MDHSYSKIMNFFAYFYNKLYFSFNIYLKEKLPKDAVLLNLPISSLVNTFRISGQNYLLTYNTTGESLFIRMSVNVKTPKKNQRNFGKKILDFFLKYALNLK